MRAGNVTMLKNKNGAGALKAMRPKAFLYGNVKLQNSSITNRKYFGSEKVFLYLTGTYMNDPFSPLRIMTDERDYLSEGPPVKTAKKA